MPRAPSSFCFNSGIKRMRVSKDIASELFYMFIPSLQVLTYSKILCLTCTILENRKSLLTPM